MLFDLGLLLLALITFGQSAVDKIADWKGNIGWLKDHFKNSLLRNQVPVALGVITVLELVTSILAILAIWAVLKEEGGSLVSYAYSTAVVTLLCLLLGQRLAKDYDGARTIVIYLIPFLLGLMSN